MIAVSLFVSASLPDAVVLFTTGEGAVTRPDTLGDAESAAIAAALRELAAVLDPPAAIAAAEDAPAEN